MGGGVGVALAGGAQAELDGGAARFAHPPGPLRGAAAVARVQLHIERALLLLLLLPPEEGRALLPAAGGTPPAGLQDVRDPPLPALFGGCEPW